jgi:hypothetical protein
VISEGLTFIGPTGLFERLHHTMGTAGVGKLAEIHILSIWWLHAVAWNSYRLQKKTDKKGCNIIKGTRET